jgi:oligopeptide/dipeptide ABC transporter ATP-binding protein
MSATSTPDTPLLDVRGLTKHYPVRGEKKMLVAANEVSFSIPAGTTLGLVGESGSGKTTVGRCVLRLVEPTEGDIHFDGESIVELSSRELLEFRRRAQLVFQEPYDSLNPRRRIREIIEEPLELHDLVPAERRRERVRELGALVGLEGEILDRYPHELSGGQQQRVGIARVLGLEPRFVVLDEPTSSLDPASRKALIELLIRLQQELGLSYLFISHDLSTIKEICHRVAVMYLGRIVETGSVQQVFDSPQHPYTIGLLASILPADPGVPRSSFVLHGEIPSAIDLPRGCPLHSRCPLATDFSRDNVPPLAEVGLGHAAACFRWEETDDLRRQAFENGSGPYREQSS